MADFELIAETEPGKDVIRFRLHDRDGVLQGAHQVRVSELDRELWNGLLDTRAYLGRDERTRLHRLGVFLGSQVLGLDITRALERSRQRRTLRIQLPDPAGDILAAALARIPWEIARSAADEADLLDRNLVVTVTPGGLPARDPLIAAVADDIARGETPLRVLLVLADTTDATPLAWRDERRYLVRRFTDDIMRHRHVELDVLCHGVTRAMLEERIRASGGYHIIHWSGHGLRDRLELRGESGAPEPISGQEFVALIDRASGFIPHLVFLSACLSGALFDVAEAKAAQPASGPHEHSTR